MKRNYFSPRYLFLAGSLFLTSVLSFSASAQSDKDHKVTICHIPPGNLDNAHLIDIDKHAIDAHIGHGDPIDSDGNPIGPWPEGCPMPCQECPCLDCTLAPTKTPNDFPIDNEKMTVEPKENMVLVQMGAYKQKD